MGVNFGGFLTRRYSVLQFGLHNNFFARSLTNAEDAFRQTRLSQFPRPTYPKALPWIQKTASREWNQYSMTTPTWLGEGGDNGSVGMGSNFESD